MEWLDIYDENGRRTDRKMVRGGPREPGDHILVTHLCLFDSGGRMLIQQRSGGKERWGGMWDLSSGGHVRSGEDSRRAVCREAEEELGLHLEEPPLFFKRFRIPQVLDDFYLLRLDIAPEALTLSGEEVAAVRWADRREVLALLESGRFIDYGRALLEEVFSAAEILL